MAEVYLAQHPRLPRRDALKVLSEAVTADGNFRERFQREADLAGALWHPNIVAVHDRGEFDGHLWIAMDYVDGTDAAHLVKGRYPTGMAIHDVCTIVSGVAAALDYAHSRDLLHRDVKPANILVTEPEDSKRRILLADFGIAAGSWLPAVLWGVAFATLVRGLPVDARGHIDLSIGDVLNVYTLLGGLATSTLLNLVVLPALVGSPVEAMYAATESLSHGMPYAVAYRPKSV